MVGAHATHGLTGEFSGLHCQITGAIYKSTSKHSSDGRKMSECSRKMMVVLVAAKHQQICIIDNTYQGLYNEDTGRYSPSKYTLEHGSFPA